MTLAWFLTPDEPQPDAPELRGLLLVIGCLAIGLTIIGIILYTHRRR
jgi:hypothetical protein